MLEVKLLISELDYDGLVDIIVPIAAAKAAGKGGLLGRLASSRERISAAAHKFLSGKDQNQRDLLAAEMAEKNKAVLMEKAAALAEKTGVRVQICDISVRKI